MNGRIGFMQGRLSPMVAGKIQAFPVNYWREEFAEAARIGLSLMEWTIDDEDFDRNPLIQEAGRVEIAALRARFGLRIESLTADNMMQMPFWKLGGERRAQLMVQFRVLVEACAEAGIGVVVVPLVDNGSLGSMEDELSLRMGIAEIHPLLSATGVRVAFESDFAPERLAEFIRSFPAEIGINFDIGNSASLGWLPTQEIPLLAERIVNIHVKDRVRGGGTVPFGTGAVNFELVFDQLQRAGVHSNLILQGARASDNDHSGALLRYAALVEGLI